MQRRFGLALVALPVVAVACGASPAAPAAPPAAESTVVFAPYPPPAGPTAVPAPPPAPATARPPTGAACAGDAGWVSQVGGKPVVSTLMRFDAMRRRGGFGADGPIVTYNDFTEIRRTSEEKYEWPATELGDRLPDLIVLRNASGSVPKGYGAPTKHPSGVVEHAPGASHPRLSPSAFTLFVFPDGTWVRAEGGAMTSRVRDLFAIPGTAPPMPTADQDVAWEICGAMDVNELGLPYDRWTLEGERVAARLFASRQEGELVYPFVSPELATRAASEQASRCGRAGCGWLTSSSVEGPLVRYGVHIRTAPTSARTVLQIAEPTLPLAAPPPANAPATPGAPPSGVYQQFVDIRSDTCPTHAAGQPFPSMMTSVLVTHKNGKANATLESSDPRAPGMLTYSAMNDVELVVGAVAKKEAKHLCANYTIARTMTVLAVTGDTIRVRDEVRHVGSTAGCRHASLPSNCATESLTTWKLARKACDAPCDATPIGRAPSFTEGEPAPRLNVKCACP